MKKEEIIQSTEKILSFSQAYPFPLNAGPLIDQWYTAKKPFIDLFGGKTFVRSFHKVKVSLPQDEKDNKFNEFIDILDKNGVLSYSLDDHSITLGEFIEKNKKGFFENRVTAPIENKHIYNNSKLLKSFKHFIQDPQTVRWTQDTASQYIQQNKLEGYLYLSVDPVDFLTLSDNNANWTSCHRLDGDFREGNLSYMVDDTTIIAFIADESPENMRCLPPQMKAYSKKWRILLHTDRDKAIWYSKPYPFESYTLLSEVNKMMSNYLKDSYTSAIRFGFKMISKDAHAPTVALDNNFIEIYNEIFNTKDLIDISDYYGYCDIINSGNYTPYIAIKATLYYGQLSDDYYSITGSSPKQDILVRNRLVKNLKNTLSLKIGKAPICPCCGRHTLKDSSSSYLCPCCRKKYNADLDFFTTCENCGTRIYEDEDNYIIGKEHYCQFCYNALMEVDI